MLLMMASVNRVCMRNNSGAVGFEQKAPQRASKYWMSFFKALWLCAMRVVSSLHTSARRWYPITFTADSYFGNDMGLDILHAFAKLHCCGFNSVGAVVNLPKDPQRSDDTKAECNSPPSTQTSPCSPNPAAAATLLVSNGTKPVVQSK